MRHKIEAKIKRVRYCVTLLQDYEEVDARVICEEALRKLDEIETYLRYLEEAL